MNTSKQNQFMHDSDVTTALGETRNEASSSAPSPAEETLRLIARLPAPQGLAERVKAGLCGGQSAPPVSGRARILPWPTALRMENTWVRGAAAAAIALVVVGGGWGIYARVAPVQPQKAMVLPHNAAQGGFSSAGAVRKPQTLNRPVMAHSATAAPQAAKATAKPAAQPKQTPPHRSKVASADKTDELPATPPVTPTEK
jgi:hypothetical protein